MGCMRQCRRKGVQDGDDGIEALESRANGSHGRGLSAWAGLAAGQMSSSVMILVAAPERLKRNL